MKKCSSRVPHPIEQPVLAFGDDSVNKKSPVPRYVYLFEQTVPRLGRKHLFSKSEIAIASNERTTDSDIFQRVLSVLEASGYYGKNVLLLVYISTEDIANAKRRRAVQRIIHLVDKQLSRLMVDHRFISETFEMRMINIE